MGKRLNLPSINSKVPMTTKPNDFCKVALSKEVQSWLYLKIAQWASSVKGEWKPVQLVLSGKKIECNSPKVHF